MSTFLNRCESQKSFHKPNPPPFMFYRHVLLCVLRNTSPSNNTDLKKNRYCIVTSSRDHAKVIDFLFFWPPSFLITLLYELNTVLKRLHSYELRIKNKNTSTIKTENKTVR